MIRLSKHTYVRVREAIVRGRLCELPHDTKSCDVCRRAVLSLLHSPGENILWCLCEYHQREVGVLW